MSRAIMVRNRVYEMIKVLSVEDRSTMSDVVSRAIYLLLETRKCNGRNFPDNPVFRGMYERFIDLSGNVRTRQIMRGVAKEFAGEIAEIEEMEKELDTRKKARIRGFLSKYV